MIAIEGKLLQLPDSGSDVRYAAASPADRMSTFAGSGMPFATEEQAFDNTPNIGNLDVRPDGTYSAQVLYPNSYYHKLGSVDLVPPTLYISYYVERQRVTVSSVLGTSIPFRTITYPKGRHDVLFYDRGSHDLLHPDRDARTQECILRESAYPLRQPTDFWGKVTPL